MWNWRRKTGRARRMGPIALGPSVRPRSSWRRGAVLGLLLLLVGSALWQRDRILDPLLEVRAVEVRGLTCAPRDDLLTWLDIGVGTSLLSLPRVRFAEASEAFPRIERIRWRWEPLQKLRLTVSERPPVALFLTADGEAWEVAPDGVAWAPAGTLPDMPLLVQGPSSTFAVDRRGEHALVTGLEKVLGWLGHLEREYPALWAEVSQVQPMAPGLWRCTLCSSHRVLVVPEDVGLSQWSAVESILADLDRREHVDAVLDMRFDDRVVVRLPS